MKYQLVLQWSASSSIDFDEIIKLEDILIGNLSSDNKVDGHDFGRGEMNIFILTNEPMAAFNQIKTSFANYHLLANVRAAFREVMGSEFTILWPKGLNEFKVA